MCVRMNWLPPPNNSNPPPHQWSHRGWRQPLRSQRCRLGCCFHRTPCLLSHGAPEKRETNVHCFFIYFVHITFGFFFFLNHAICTWDKLDNCHFKNQMLKSLQVVSGQTVFPKATFQSLINLLSSTSPWSATGPFSSVCLICAAETGKHFWVPPLGLKIHYYWHYITVFYLSNLIFRG